MFGWLFRSPLSRDEVIRIAAEFLLQKWKEHTADWPPEEAAWPYVFERASLGGSYWYVGFRYRPVEGLIRSHDTTEIWVHKYTGEVDYGEEICRRYYEKEVEQNR